MIMQFFNLGVISIAEPEEQSDAAPGPDSDFVH
jgi:hypothetical protein